MEQFPQKSGRFLKKILSALPIRRRRGLYHLPIVIERQELPRDPLSRFLRQILAISVSMLLLMSMAPSTLLETGFSADVLSAEGDGTDDLAQDEHGLFLQDDLYLLKENVNGDFNVSRIGVTDMVTHTVEEGETLSLIAERYGLKTETLLWENRLYDGDRLKVGQTLMIPPLNGVSIAVSQGQTLDKIAKIYKVTPEIIREHNKLNTDVVNKGQRLFLPGGKPLPQAPVYARNGARGIRVAQNTFDIRSPTVVAQGSTNGKLIFPTNGSLSRGFIGGHYALDIANRTKPDVWAAKAGRVITSKGGCPVREEGRYLSCGSGYGNYVVIDHGDGIQTVYAHLETLYVEEGMQVETGQLIGKMGNTGRSYGATGIHLHFEVIDKGVKRNGMKYF